jgi:F-type H+-transporting ATPase subunit gamma
VANLRDIKRRIKSVSSTKQITHTMEMVSTTKIMRALKRAEDASPYKEAMTTMLANVVSAGGGTGVPLFESHGTVKRALIIAVASDRGLAGGFNVQIERGIEHRIVELREKGIESELITCGKKPSEYFMYRGYEPVLHYEGLSAEPTLAQAEQIASYIMSGYENGRLDHVEMWYQHAKNRVEQVLTVEKILPIMPGTLRLPNAPRSQEALSTVEASTTGDFDFDPSPDKVLGYLMPAYIRTVLYHALIDSAAAEHGARRRAMQAATDNADEIIETLSREYNRIRQSSITTELNEIVGGAAALEEK